MRFPHGMEKRGLAMRRRRADNPRPHCLVIEIIKEIWAGFADASLLDLANLVLGLVGVVLMIRRSLWAFPVGLIAVSVQGVLFWQTRFYADATLQAFFFVALAYGWWHWVHDRGGRKELPVSRMSQRALALTLAATVAGWAAWALYLRHGVADAAMPWRDAFIASFSVAAQVLQARKKLENWPLWMLVNGVAVHAYWSAGLAFTTFLYLVYLGLAVAGWRAWLKPHAGEQEPAGAEA